METKVCSKCKEEKKVSDFEKDRLRKSGLTSACKKCRNFYRQKWRKKHPEKNREYGKRWRVKNREKYIEGRKRRRHSQKSLESNRALLKRNRDNLTDAYIKNLLSFQGFDIQDLNSIPGLIKLKKIQIQGKREAKKQLKK